MSPSQAPDQQALDQQAPKQQAPKQLVVSTRLRTVKGRVPEPVKHGLRRSTRAFGMATAGQRTEPDFLIIGTKRGGTTSLWNAMLDHPDVLPIFPGAQELKSAHYFDIDYAKGPRWYGSHFPTRRQRRRHAEQTGRDAVAGEASPYYLFHPLAAQRISEDLPDVKLIVSLRDPVERVWSHYSERRAGRTETLGFEDALAAEPGRLAGEAERIIAQAPDYYSFHHDLSSYLARGRYLEQLQPFLDRFGPDRLLILRAEDYYSDEAGELQTVADFIGMQPFPSRAPKPNHYNKLPREPMAPQTRDMLIDYYQPHVTELEQALGRDFQWTNFK